MKPKTAFVIMPFGKRDLADGTEHDFDAFYWKMLRPVAQAEGFDVRRVDEIVASGTVTDQAFRLLYSADVVVADVSAPNSNVYYELGVRQGISPGPVILVAATDTALPFDIHNQRVLFYSREYESDKVFRQRYRDALLAESELWRNPVQNTLRELGITPDPQVDRAAFEHELTLKINRASRDDQLVAVWNWAKQFPYLPTAGLLALADRLAKVEDYANAAVVLNAAYPAADQDFEVHRQRGFYLRKHGEHEAGLAELERALQLNPHDPQALGMVAGTLKRQGQYAEALRNYEQALSIAPKSLYLKVARAGMVILADPSRLQEAKDLYADLRREIEQSETLVGDYWAELVAAEACFVLGDQERAYDHGRNAVRNGAPVADSQSTAEQIRMLGDAGVHPDFAARFSTWLVKHTRSGGRTGVLEDRESGDQSQIIFHISDTHFGKLIHKGERISTHRFIEDENTRRLSMELKDEFLRFLRDSRTSSQDVTLVLSGDITSSGAADEFREAESFLAELCDGAGLARDQVVIVPGNHDVDWHEARENKAKRFDNYLDFVKKFYGEETFYKLFPLVEWDFNIGSERPLANQIIYVQRRGSLTFVGMNSCVFEDDQHHYGYIGMHQLRNINTLLKTSDSERIESPGERIAVAVMHHHLHPYPEPLRMAKKANDVIPDMSTIRDAGLVEQRLSRLGFSLVLHGHKHRPQLRETNVRIGQEGSPFGDRQLIVCGSGSTGAAAHELEHNQSNHYQMINFLRRSRETGANFVRIEWRELALQPGAEWTTSGRWVITG